MSERPDVGVPSDTGPSDTDTGVGEHAIAAQLAALEGLAERPVADHPEIYANVHTALQSALGDVAHIAAIDDTAAG